MKTEVEPLLSIPEACALLKISRPTFYRLLNKGKLAVVRVGSGVRVDPEEIRAFKRRNVSNEA